VLYPKADGLCISTAATVQDLVLAGYVTMVSGGYRAISTVSGYLSGPQGTAVIYMVTCACCFQNKCADYICYSISTDSSGQMARKLSVCHFQGGPVQTGIS